MKICFATSECVPFVKTGGLGDVSSALPKELGTRGHDVKVFLPLYKSINKSAHDLVVDKRFTNMSVNVGGKKRPFKIWAEVNPSSDIEYFFVHSSQYFDRPGVYTNDTDEDERYLLFQLAIFETIRELSWAPDVLHANDWPTALLPVFLRDRFNKHPLFAQTASILSIHNIGYQGQFDLSTVQKAGLPKALALQGGDFEFYGGFSFLKAGISYADVVSTVSPTYANEIQTPEYGHGLDGVLRSVREPIQGVLNGIDDSVWNPETDQHIAARYGPNSLSQKGENKRALVNRFNLSQKPDLPLIGIISRLTSQKGFNLLEPILNDLLKSKTARFIVLGSGDKHLERMFLDASHLFPEDLAAFIGYDEELAHQIEAGSDIFLMPSLYEPCGLNQMYSLKYGTVPVVRETGGLADTVVDIKTNPLLGNGFTFQQTDPAELYRTIRRAISRYDDKYLWHVIQRRGMLSDFSWRHSAGSYVALYQIAIDVAAPKK